MNRKYFHFILSRENCLFKISLLLLRKVLFTLTQRIFYFDATSYNMLPFSDLACSRILLENSHTDHMPSFHKSALLLNSDFFYANLGGTLKVEMQPVEY